jgi:hypothetical protein
MATCFIKIGDRNGDRNYKPVALRMRDYGEFSAYR